MRSPGSEDSMSLISSRLTSENLGLLQSFLTLSCLFGDNDLLLGLGAFGGGSGSDTAISLSEGVSLVSSLLAESSSLLKSFPSSSLGFIAGFSLSSSRTSETLLSAGIGE